MLIIKIKEFKKGTIFILFTISVFLCTCHPHIEGRKSTEEEKSLVLKKVPLITQKGDLDCGLASRAMLLKYFDDNITYEQTIYESGACHGFLYRPLHLRFFDLGFNGSSFVEDYKWLGKIHGLNFTHHRIGIKGETFFYKEPPTEIVEGEKEAWNRYLEILEYYLKKGVPVQTSKSWKPTPLGSWWDGIPEKHRPGNHFMVVTGLDRKKGIVYINSSWPTLGKIIMGIEDFRKSIEIQDWPILKYWIRVFEKVDSSKVIVSKNEIKERNLRKLKGEIDVYSPYHAELGAVFGLNGLKYFKEDLRPEKFWEIIENWERIGISRLEIIVGINLFMYQYSFLTKMGTKYLKNQDPSDNEYILFTRLHSSYEGLRILSEKMKNYFKTSENIPKLKAKCNPILEKMRKEVDEIIISTTQYLETN